MIKNKFLFLLPLVLFLSLTVVPKNSYAFDFSSVLSFFNPGSVLSKVDTGKNVAAVSDFSILSPMITDSSIGSRTVNFLEVLLDYNNSYLHDSDGHVKKALQTTNDNLLRESSYGKVRATFTALDSYKTNDNFYTSGFTAGSAVVDGKDIEAAIKFNHIDLSKYDIIDANASPFTGNTGGLDNLSFENLHSYDGTLYHSMPVISVGAPFLDSYPVNGLDVNLHEYIHSLGIGHALAISCGNTTKGITGSANVAEIYDNGDTAPEAPYTNCILQDQLEPRSPYSLMSGSNFGTDLNAFEKDAAGFFTQTDNLNVARNDYYILGLNYTSPTKIHVDHLSSISSQEKGIKAVKVYSLDKRIYPLYIETRDHQTGLDSSSKDFFGGYFAPDKLAFGDNGLLINMVQGSAFGLTTNLLDLNPAKNKFALISGSSYTDIARGITISNVSGTPASGMSFDVTLTQPNFNLIQQSTIPGLWHPVYDIDSISTQNPIKLGDLATMKLKLKNAFPSNTGYRFNIDWGDGATGDFGFPSGSDVESCDAYPCAHTYSSTGIFTQKVSVYYDTNLGSMSRDSVRTAQSSVYVQSLNVSSTAKSFGTYDFSIQLKGFPCDSVLTLDRGDGGVTTQTVACDPGKSYIDSKTVDQTLTYSAGDYTLTASVGTISASTEIKVVPPKPTLSLKRSGSILTVDLGKVDDYNVTHNISPLLSSAGYNFQIYHDTAEDPGQDGSTVRSYLVPGVYAPVPFTFACDRSHDTNQCIDELPLSKFTYDNKWWTALSSGNTYGHYLLNYKINPDSDYYFYIRTLSSDKVSKTPTASDWVEATSFATPVNYFPGDSIKESAGTAGDTFLPITLTVKRDKVVSKTQVVNNYFSEPAVNPPEVRLGSRNGTSADVVVDATTGAKQFVVPVTFAPTDLSKDVTIYVDFKSENYSSPVISWAVNQGTSKAPENITSDNTKNYDVSGSFFDYSISATPIVIDRPADNASANYYYPAKSYVTVTMKSAAVSGNQSAYVDLPMADGTKWSHGRGTVPIPGLPSHTLIESDSSCSGLSVSGAGDFFPNYQSRYMPDQGASQICALQFWVYPKTPYGIYPITFHSTGGGLSRDVTTTLEIRKVNK